MRRAEPIFFPRPPSSVSAILKRSDVLLLLLLFFVCVCVCVCCHRFFFRVFFSPFWPAFYSGNCCHRLYFILFFLGVCYWTCSLFFFVFLPENEIKKTAASFRFFFFLRKETKKFVFLRRRFLPSFFFVDWYEMRTIVLIVFFSSMELDRQGRWKRKGDWLLFR